MSQASDRFNISLDGGLSRPPRTRKAIPTTSDRFRLDIPVSNFVPVRPQADNRFDIVTEGDIARYAHHRRPEYKSTTDDRFGSIFVPEKEERQGSSDRFASINVDGPEDRHYERSGPSVPSDRFAAVEMQDPRRMARNGGSRGHGHGHEQPQTKISIRNQFSELIENAIVHTKTIAPVPAVRVVGGSGSDIIVDKKKQQQNKKQKMTNLDDLDEDRPINTAANKALIAKLQAEEGQEEKSEDEDVEDSGPLTKAERKALKQQKKRERLEAAGYGYLYTPN